jgi:hypothetical protein
MENEKADKLIDKIMEGGTLDSSDTGHQPYSEPETPINYADWVKQQPRGKK